MTEDQKRQIKPIVDESIIKEKLLFEETKQKIEATLQPEQKAKLDALISIWFRRESAWIRTGTDEKEGPFHPGKFDEFTEGLNLTDEQKAKLGSSLGPIMEKAHKKEVEEVTSQISAQLVSILTPEQQQVLADRIKLQEDEAKLEQK